MSDITITFTILAAAVALFVWNRVPVAVVALGVALALFYTGVLDAGAAFAGLGDPVVIFIATLFVISTGLEAAGVTTWAGQILIEKAGTSRTRLLVLLMLVCVLFTAAMSFIGAVAALLPVAVVAAMRVGMPISQIAMPLAFSASAGGLLTLVGSPVNVLLSNAAEDAGLGGFGFFEFAIAGIPLVLGTGAIIVLLGRYLLPRAQRRVAALRLQPARPHAGRAVPDRRRLASAAGQGHLALCRRAAVGRHAGRLPGVEPRLDPGRGRPRRAHRPTIAEGDVLPRARRRGIGGAPRGRQASRAARRGGRRADIVATLFNRESGLAEVVIPPRSNLIGRKVFPGMVTRDGDLIVLAVAAPRRGPGRAADDARRRRPRAAAGDLGGARPEAGRSGRAVRRLARPRPPPGRGAGTRARSGRSPCSRCWCCCSPRVWCRSVVAGVTCACAMVLFGVLTIPAAYKGIDWNTLILLGGMIPLSTAMTQSGAADLMAEQLLAMVGDAGPRALLAGLFVLTLVLGQLISNTATALIIAPIAVAAAMEYGVSPRPVLMSIAVAAAASFFTPVATPPNVMVMGPGGYRFGDYWKLGLPCALWFGVVAVFLVPLWWRF